MGTGGEGKGLHDISTRVTTKVEVRLRNACDALDIVSGHGLLCTPALHSCPHRQLSLSAYVHSTASTYDTAHLQRAHATVIC